MYKCNALPQIKETVLAVFLLWYCITWKVSC